jgi:hypothetical protein
MEHEDAGDDGSYAQQRRQDEQEEPPTRSPEAPGDSLFQSDFGNGHRLDVPTR